MPKIANDAGTVGFFCDFNDFGKSFQTLILITYTQIAKAPAERDLLFGGNLLVTKEDDLMIQQCLMHSCKILSPERFRQIGAKNLSATCARDWIYFYGYWFSLKVSKVVNDLHSVHDSSKEIKVSTKKSILKEVAEFQTAVDHLDRRLTELHNENNAAMSNKCVVCGTHRFDVQKR